MQDEHWGGKLAGEVECDETFIGGKARNMHKDRKRGAQKVGGHKADKTIVFGMVERGGTVRTVTVPDQERRNFTSNSKRTWKRDRQSSPMNCHPTWACAKSTSMKS